MKTIISNPFFGPQEGFGEQYKITIFYMIYAELNGYDFVYTPFKSIAHNYDNDPNFVHNLEQMIGLIHYLSMPSSNIKIKNCFIADVIHFLHNNMDQFENSIALQTVRNCFYNVNSKPTSIDSEFLHICVHIRRPNLIDNRNTNRGVMVPDEVYIEIMNQLATLSSERHKIFHVISQGDESNFVTFKNGNTHVQLHINENLQDTFKLMVYSDILIVSPSALSYTAGLVSKNQVFYIRHCNPPLPSWSVIQGYQSQRMYHKFLYNTTVYFDSEKGEYIIFKDGYEFSPLRII